jgi:hypothetical protein
MRHYNSEGLALLALLVAAGCANDSRDDVSNNSSPVVAEDAGCNCEPLELSLEWSGDPCEWNLPGDHDDEDLCSTTITLSNSVERGRRSVSTARVGAASACGDTDGWYISGGGNSVMLCPNLCTTAGGIAADVAVLSRDCGD